MTEGDRKKLFSKKAPSVKALVAISLFWVFTTAAALIIAFTSEIEDSLFSIYRIHFIFPVLFIVFAVLITRWMNQKINADLKRNVKVIRDDIVNRIQYSRVGAYAYSGKVSGSIGEYKIRFNSGLKFKSYSKDLSLNEGYKVKVHFAPESRTVLSIEKV